VRISTARRLAPLPDGGAFLSILPTDGLERIEDDDVGRWSWAARRASNRGDLLGLIKAGPERRQQ
jgi:hypothetical protein